MIDKISAWFSTCGDIRVRKNVYQDVLHTFAIDAESLRSACTTCTPFAESALALSEAGSRVSALMVTFPDFNRASTTPPPCD